MACRICCRCPQYPPFALCQCFYRECCIRAGYRSCMCIRSFQYLTSMQTIASDNLEAKAGVDIGTKYKTAGALYKKSLDAPGRKLDLEAMWKEKGGQVDLGAVYKHDTQKKASIKYVSLSMSCAPPASLLKSHQTQTGLQRTSCAHARQIEHRPVASKADFCQSPSR